jgi:hypothetical protein
VHYASDLDVCTFGSGFCAPPGTNVPFNQQDASGSGINKATSAKSTVNTSDANFDYSRTGWNCLNLPTVKVGLLVRHTDRHLPQYTQRTRSI